MMDWAGTKIGFNSRIKETKIIDLILFLYCYFVCVGGVHLETIMTLPCIYLLPECQTNSDEMERLYIHLKQASLSPIGERKPSTKRDFRASFIKRCKNQTINDKLHVIRTLNSTLKVRLSAWELLSTSITLSSII